MFRPDFVQEHLQALEEHDKQLVLWVRANVGYDAQNGELFDLKTEKPLTRRRSNGKATVTLMGQTLTSAVGVWFWHHESFPAGTRFKRMNGDRTDDHIENLGIFTRDGCLEGAGHRWVAREAGASRNDIIGVFRSYEGALRAVEKAQRSNEAARAVLDLV